MNPAMKRCGHGSVGGDGVVRFCDKGEGHAGWHGETVVLRGPGGSYPSTTNWGDDGKGIHASAGRKVDGEWVHPNDETRRTR